jgi:hypothetical protein
VATLNFTMDMSEWMHAFQSIQSRAGDLTPAHEEIGDFMIAETQDNIEWQGQETFWPPLKPETLAERHRKYPDAGDKMLIVTRELIGSISKDARAAFVDVGSALKKARTLFFGRGNIPARFPFAWKAGTLAKVGGMYLDHLFGRLK